MPELPEQLLRLPRVIEVTGYSRASIYAKVSEGSFPKPVRLGGRASAWLASEINGWIRERIAASRGTE
jgi:prophage regulatory protein